MLPTADDLDAIPTPANGWHYDPDAPSNGLVWRAADAHGTVVVMDRLSDEIDISVTDDRVSGIEASIPLSSVSYDVDDANPVEVCRATAADALRDAVEEAREWMSTTPANDWRHPDISHAAFQAPPGYEFLKYYRQSRETVVHYQLKGSRDKRRVAGVGSPDDVTPQSHPYLVIHTWRGSGNSTVDISPYEFGHDHERTTVVKPPEECGFEVALSLAREWAREEIDDDGPDDPDDLPIGQTAIQQFSGLSSE